LHQQQAQLLYYINGHTGAGKGTQAMHLDPPPPRLLGNKIKIKGNTSTTEKLHFDKLHSNEIFSKIKHLLDPLTNLLQIFSQKHFTSKNNIVIKVSA
jgi:hypothetical protein